MILIDNVLINEEILSTKFHCDLKNCKGSCCTFPGESGAPVLKDEIGEIEKLYPIFSKYMSETSKEYVKEHGFWEKDGKSLALKCINKRDCVFVFYDGDIAKCSIEKAFHNGEIAFRKPISCHLFPIRVANYGGDYLHYEQFDECEPGRELGKNENYPLLENVKSALIRKYGEEFYKKLLQYSLEQFEGQIDK